jgi:hypothetical protein
LKGSWNWATTTKIDFNLKERSILDAQGHENSTFNGWTWVKGGITLYDEGLPTVAIAEGEAVAGEVGSKTNIEYEVYGLHHVRNGTYRLFGMPEGMRLDIRRIPTLFDNQEEHDLASQVILLEMEKELLHQQENLLLMDARVDCTSFLFLLLGCEADKADDTRTSCPILVYMTVPPLPQGTSPQELERYEEESLRSSGIRLSLPKPPNYWDGVGLGGIIVADQCGVALGFDKGHGVRIDDFWRKSVNCTFSCCLYNVTQFRRLIIRCFFRYTAPTCSATSPRSADGDDAYPICPVESLGLDGGHDGRLGFLDL